MANRQGKETYMRRISHKRALGATLAITALSLLAFSGSASAAFSQCPTVGFDTGCAILITINPNGEASSATDFTQRPFDGLEDTLLGVQNNSPNPVTSVKLTGPAIFGFDGDGVCSGVNTTGEAGFEPPPSGCPFGTEEETSPGSKVFNGGGYEGPNTSFTFANFNEGTVNFPAPGGLAAGASTYFSLEEPIEELRCHELECGVVPPCTSIIGVGHFGPKGPGGLNLNDNLNTGLVGKQEFEFTTGEGEIGPGRAHMKLTQLEAASCKAIAGGKEFRGSGTGTFRGVKGDHIFFRWAVRGSSIEFEVEVEEGGSVVYLKVAILNPKSHEMIS
jgi:hypothetical protein